MPENSFIQKLSAVEETAFLTLYARAIESQSDQPILKDEKAEEIVRRLDLILENRGTKMARQLITRKIDPRLVVHLTLRAEKYDRYTKSFLKKQPDATVVNIGCGLDSRFSRVDNGKTTFFDIDLPEMIAIKQQLLEENPRYHMIGKSVLDDTWMDEVEKSVQPSIFLLEGVLMYLPEKDVKHLILTMLERFPGAELVCELTHRTWVEGFWGKMAALKMRSRTKIDQAARFKFGVSSPEELAEWSEGIEFLEHWFYMDDGHRKIGWMRIFRNWKIFRTAQYTAHYRFSGK